MIQHIIDGICIKLNETFGDAYTIYTEAVKQGLKEPCFIVRLVNPVSKTELGRRYLRQNLFAIHYLPKSSEEPKAECYRVLEELYLAMEYITVNGDLQRGVGMRSELVDDVLHIYVNYNMYVHIPQDYESMAELVEHNITTKG